MSHPITSTSALEPMRALALYLASYIDTWPDLIAQHQKTLTEFPTSSDTATILQFVAPHLLAHLENSERKAVATQNMLLHSLTQHGLESLRAQTVVGQHSGQQVLEKLSTAQPATQTLIHAYYLLHLRGDALSARVGLTDKEIIPALCRARTELDWLNKADVWQVADGEYLFPSLITDYFSGRIDKDSEKLLVDTISKDLSRLVGFERQFRIHLLLSAAFASLPFPPSRSDSQASNAKQKGITLGESRPRSGPRLNTGSSATKSARLTTVEHGARSPSYAPVYIVGGCLILAGILALLLISNSADTKPTIKIPEVQSPTTISTSRDTGREKENRISEKNSPEIKPNNIAQQTLTLVAPANKIVPVIDSPSVINQDVNLMALIDTAKDAVSGNWVKSDPSTLSAIGWGDKTTLLQIPYRPSNEYDLRITFARLVSNNEIAVIVVNQGVQCAGIIGAWKDTVAGFSLVGGQMSGSNATRADSPKIVNDKKYVLMLSVRKERMQLFLDDKLITSWEPAHGKLSTNAAWALRDPDAIGLGIKNGKCSFYDIQIREISGNGNYKPTSPALAQSLPNTSIPNVIVPDDKTISLTGNVTARQGYLAIRDRSFAELVNGKNTVARKIINDAISNPAYATFTNDLQLDLSCVTLADENLAAVIVGAKSLINIFEYTLEDKSGTKILLGRSHDNQVKAVNDSGLTLETKLGNGYLHREIPFMDLSPATRAGLAREAQKNKPDAELRALIGSMLQQKPDAKPANIIFLRAWVRKASIKEGQAALAAHFNKQIDALEKVSAFDQRLQELEAQAAKNEPETLIKPLADLAKDMTESTSHPELWLRHKNVADVINKRQRDIDAEKAVKKAAELARLAQVPLSNKLIHEWDFTKGQIETWTAQKEITQINVVNGALVGVVSENPSRILASNLKIPITDAGYFEIRIRAEKAGVASIYFTSTPKPKMTFAAKHEYNGIEWVTLRFDITKVTGFNQDLTQLRIDLQSNETDIKAKFEIQSIKILR